MNSRQKEIIRTILFGSRQHYLVDDLAKKVGCSEKTIRNDFKKIEEYLATFGKATLIRKPGLGVYLEIDDEEKAILFQKLNMTKQTMDFISDEERILQIAYTLLMEDKPVSAQDLSIQYFVNRTVIKKDQEILKNWFEQFHLSLVSKQKVGLNLEGTEKSKRKALSRLSELTKNHEMTIDFIKGQFLPHEISNVELELQEMTKANSLYFTDETYDSLLLHTLLMIKRVKLKQPISIFEKEREQIRNKKEYTWTVAFVKKLESFFALHFAQDEILYLTLHISGGKMRYRHKNGAFAVNQLQDPSPLLDQLISSLTKSLSDLYGIDFTKDSSLIDGLKVHLYTTINRLNYGLAVSNPMLHEIKNMYPYMFNLVMVVLENINAKLPFNIPEEEAAYLTLHFQAAVERFERDKGFLVKAVVVCHMGIGMSQLLRTKIEKNMRLLQIVDCISKDDLKHFLTEHEVDFVISTVELAGFDIPFMVISPLFEVAEERKLTDFIKQLQRSSRKKRESAFMQFTNPFLIFLQTEAADRYELIEHLATTLYKKGYVEIEFIASTAEREKLSSTSIGGGIAIPHGSPKFIRQSAVAIATLKRPLEWGTEKVSIVFMMALKSDNKHEIRRLYQELSSFYEKPENMYKLLKENDSMKFLDKLNQL